MSKVTLRFHTSTAGLMGIPFPEKGKTGGNSRFGERLWGQVRRWDIWDVSEMSSGPWNIGDKGEVVSGDTELGVLGDGWSGSDGNGWGLSEWEWEEKRKQQLEHRGNRRSWGRRLRGRGMGCVWLPSTSGENIVAIGKCRRLSVRRPECCWHVSHSLVLWFWAFALFTTKCYEHRLFKQACKIAGLLIFAFSCTNM